MSKQLWYKSWPKHVPKHIDYPSKPLQSLLEDSARDSPKNIAIIFQDNKLNYEELNLLSNKFANWLIKQGIKRGDRVALFIPNVPEFIICYFGIIKVGAIVVPCNFLYTKDELVYQLNNSKPKVFIAYSIKLKDRDTEKIAEDAGKTSNIKKIVLINNFQHFLTYIKDEDGERPLININPKEDIASLQYTGGTTGISKGAMLTHYNLLSNAIMFAIWLPIKSNDVCLATLPLFHSYGMTATVLSPFYSSATSILLQRFEPKLAIESIYKYKVSIFCGVPAMYHSLFSSYEKDKKVKEKLSSLKILIAGASPLPKVLAENFKKYLGLTIYEGYGLSECSPVTHCTPTDSEERIKFGSIGIPLPDTEVRIVSLDDYRKELKVNEVGELAIKGPQVMKGYWRNDEETKKVLKNGWLLTGDIAFMDDDGYFYLVDRKKDVINVAGLKVWPREVEEVLLRHPKVKEVAVFGIKDKVKGEAVAAHIIVKEGAKVSEEELIDICKNNLAYYKVPKLIKFVDRLPKTALGKVRRVELRAST
jgi:long-chain acyl-CoA synthetase